MAPKESDAIPDPDSELPTDPEELLEAVDLEDDDPIEDELDEEAGEDAPDEEGGEEGGDEDGAGKAPKKAAKGAKAKPEEEEEGTDHPVPSLDEVRSALEWAFEKEDAPAEFLDTCAQHALMVYDANRRMNLTKILEVRDVAAKHYLDCWRAARLLPLLGRTVLDLGSGAGFPGVPVALSEPNTHVVMIDSTEKKARFLQECVDKLPIPNAEVVCDRAEDHLARNRYEVVIMRAISSVRENVRLLRKVRHSLKDLVMLKGPSWSREVRAGEREAERLGFRLDTVWEHELPDELGQRAVLVYRAPGGAGL